MTGRSSFRHHAEFVPRLPRKLLAVKSGLGIYGRNNICYVEGMGSFVNLVPFVSDVACTEGAWREVRSLDACQDCVACANACPTGAIARDRFLIDNERCLTFFNEKGSEHDFPDWIPASAHHTVYGCSRCQLVCPENRPYLGNVVEPVAFTEEETGLLLRGLPLERLSEALVRKLNVLDMTRCLGALPRNLGALGMVM